MDRRVATDQRAGPGSGSFSAGPLGSRFHEAWISGVAKVVVGTEVLQRLAIQHDCRRLASLTLPPGPKQIFCGQTI
jgi:hypothetical protein